MVSRRTILSSLLMAITLPSAVFAASSPAIKVQVFKSPTCGCCTGWVDHIKAAGMEVFVNEVQDTGAVRKQLGIPVQFGSCHTAMVEGYAIEGHVPAEAIVRLLKTKPNAIGLAVPGMPMGSPGMEAGSRVQPYSVMLINKKGGASSFMEFPR